MLYFFIMISQEMHLNATGIQQSQHSSFCQSKPLKTSFPSLPCSAAGHFNQLDCCCCVDAAFLRNNQPPISSSATPVTTYKTSNMCLSVLNICIHRECATNSSNKTKVLYKLNNYWHWIEILIYKWSIGTTCSHLKSFFNKNAWMKYTMLFFTENCSFV